MTPIKITESSPPKFPCWLWSPTSRQWWQYDYCPEDEMRFTHWLPDQPTAPTTVPNRQTDKT